MKKIALILSLICALLFSGCSCGGNVPLQFDPKWGGNVIGYTETLTYDVSYSDDYSFGGYDFAKNDTLPNLTVNIDGTYVVKNEVLSLSGESIPEVVKTSTVVTGMPYIVRTTTALTLNATYQNNGDEKTSKDAYYSEAYYCPPEASLAPVYSFESYDYSLIYVTDGIELSRTVGENSIVYGTENYTVKQKLLVEEKSENIETEKTFSYEFKTIIDNASLLFALRNLNYATVSETVIPTVHPTYGEAQDLKITNFESSDITLSLIYNGEEKTDVTITTRAVKYLVSSDNKSGANQLVFVQNGEVNGILNKALIVRYVSPLSDYSAYRKAGSLIYTLKTVDYNA